jgi:MFS family permease
LNKLEVDPAPVEVVREKNVLLDPNLHVIFGVTLLAVMGVVSIAPAFPKMMTVLKISSGQIGLLMTVFTLPGVFLAPVMGIMADRYGRKKTLVPALLLFGLAGGGCALARDFSVLLVLRFFQGVGGASLLTLATTIIGDLYPGQQRTKVMGYNASVISISAAGFPAVGGVLATFGWYLPFLLPLPAVPLGLIVLFRLHSPEPEQRQHLASQFVDALKSMANTQVIGLFIATTATFILIYSTCFTFVPLLLNDRFGASPAVIGLIFACMSVVTALTSSQIGNLVHRFSEKSLLKVSFLMYALGIVLMPFVHQLWFFLVPIVIYGIGHGINLPCIQSLLAGMAPTAQRATFMSINGMVLRLGQTLGPLMAGLAFSLWGTQGVFFVGAGLALGVALLAMVLLPKKVR